MRLTNSSRLVLLSVFASSSLFAGAGKGAQQGRSYLPAEVGNCQIVEKGFFGRRAKANPLLTVNEKSDLQFIVDVNSLVEGKFQVAVASLQANDLDALSGWKEMFSDGKDQTKNYFQNGRLSVYRVAFLMEPKQDSYYAVEHLTSKQYVAQTLHNTEVSEKMTSTKVALHKEIHSKFVPTQHMYFSQETAVWSQENGWEGSLDLHGPLLDPMAHTYDIPTVLKKIIVSDNERYGKEDKLRNGRTVQFHYDVVVNGETKTMVAGYNLVAIDVSDFVNKIFSTFENIIFKETRKEIGEFIDSSRSLKNK